MKFRSRGSRPRGFTVIELVVVMVIVLIIVAISLPSLAAMIRTVKVRRSAQELADFYQQGRMRAVQDDTYYVILPNANPPGIFLDTAGNGVYTVGQPIVTFEQSVALNNANVSPAMKTALKTALLGASSTVPVITTESSTMVDADGTTRAGLAWNSRGIPCQRASATSICATGFGAWVQYIQYTVGGQNYFSAVTVNQTGRTKVWVYETSGGWH
jgi:prepilin-type N-terminal cleavage/methylation domain-containing protein